LRFFLAERRVAGSGGDAEELEAANWLCNAAIGVGEDWGIKEEGGSMLSRPAGGEELGTLAGLLTSVVADAGDVGAMDEPTTEAAGGLMMVSPIMCTPGVISSALPVGTQFLEDSVLAWYSWMEIR
jgi:hypothetical protein